jgi:hypothetical protein
MVRPIDLWTRPALAPVAPSNEGATMKTTAMRYAAAIGLLGALALLAAISAAGQIHSGAVRDSALAQYCAPPPHHDSPDLHRIYCRDQG